MYRGKPNVRLGALVALVGAAIVLMAWPASAQTDRIPLLPLPTPFPSLIQQLTDTLSNTLTDATSLLQSVPEQLGGVLGGVLGGTSAPPAAPGGKKVIVDPRTVPSWSHNRSPLTGKIVPSTVPVPVGSTATHPSSYAAQLSDGLGRAARRAANLAGPLAAPIAVAIFAVALLMLAARGPGRLVKIEDQKRAFHEQQSYRL